MPALILAIILACWAGAGMADSPYLGRYQCPLSESETLQILYGDGLFGPESMAFIVHDAAGNLLAYREAGIGSFPLVGAGCEIFDTAERAVLRPDPDGFRRGPRVVGPYKETAEGLWAFAPGGGQAGFGFSDATPGRFGPVRLIASEITYNALSFGMITLAGLGGFGLIALNLSIWRRWSSLWTRIGASGASLVALWPLALLIGVALIFEAPSEAFLVVAAVCALMCFLLLRRARILLQRHILRR